MLAQQLINGITLGGIYAVVALGYTMVFGVLDIINMAHGEVVMFGAFAGMLLASGLGAPLWAVFAGAVMAAGALGYLLELLSLRPLRRRRVTAKLAPLISTIGVSILLENVALKLFGPGNHPFKTPLSDMKFSLAGVDIYLVQMVILGISLMLAAALYLWLYRTKEGLSLRAVAEDSEIASILGVNIDRAITITVVTASMAGGAAGVLIGMAYSNVSTQMGVSIGLKGLAIIIFGGMGSVGGAVAGGLILGLAETLIAAYWDSGYRDAAAFFIITLVLLVRPQGLFGRDAAAMRH